MPLQCKALFHLTEAVSTNTKEKHCNHYPRDIYSVHSEYTGPGECLILTIHTRSVRGAVIDNCARGQARGP